MLGEAHYLTWMDGWMDGREGRTKTHMEECMSSPAIIVMRCQRKKRQMQNLASLHTSALSAVKLRSTLLRHNLFSQSHGDSQGYLSYKDICPKCLCMFVLVLFMHVFMHIPQTMYHFDT